MYEFNLINFVSFSYVLKIINHYYSALLFFYKSYAIFCIEPIILSYFYKIISNKKKLQFVIWTSKNRSKLNRINLDRIGFLKLIIQNRTEPHIILTLDRMSFYFKTDLDRTANILSLLWSLTVENLRFF